MNRRQFVMTSACLIAAGPAFSETNPTLQVAKTPTCGCCGAWVDRMRAAGFDATVENVDQDTLWAMKQELGITSELAGCHTASVGDYFVEGHVPAADIRRLLKEAPDARGLAAPGMPMGSPGMETDGAGERYDVLLVLMDGSTQVFASHG